MTNRQTMWAIQQENGRFYYGTSPSRVCAIARHVYAYDEKLCAKGCPDYLTQAALSDLQQKVWRQRQASGDKVVRVRLEATRQG